MPLQTNTEGIIAYLYSFYYTIVRVSRYFENAWNSLQSLVVIAVGPDTVTEQAVKNSVLLDSDRVAYIAPICFLHMFGDSRRKLG